MAAVTIREGVRYGASLLGYFVILFIAGGIVIAIGAGLFFLENIVATLIGAIFYIIGIIILYAGLLGVSYKLIADGVARGIRSIQSSTSGAEMGGAGAGGGLLDSILGSTDGGSTERSEEPRTRE